MRAAEYEKVEHIMFCGYPGSRARRHNTSPPGSSPGRLVRPYVVPRAPSGLSTAEDRRATTRSRIAGRRSIAGVRSVSDDTRLRFAVLGPLRAWCGERELALGSPQQTATLTALLLRSGHQATVGELIDAIWGDAPPRAAVATLRTYISRLRRVFGDAECEGGRVASIGDGYRLALSAGELDLAAFERLAAAAEPERAAGDFQAAAGHLHEALQLWRGVALAGVPGPYAEQQRHRLGERRLAVLGDRLDADLALGRHLEVTAELAELKANYPLLERFREQLMLALYRSGRQADALAAFQDARAALIDELGIEPGPGLQELHQRILAADPSLGVESRATVVAGPVAAPGQLPADLGDFTGRSSVVAELQRGLTAPRPTVTIVAVTGLGGVGKTSLAVHVGHAVRDHFPDGQLYLALRGMSDQPGDPGQLLSGLLAALGVPTGAQPPGLDDKAALYRSLVATRRMLVILDDAGDDEQVRWLLPGSPSCAVIVTSRRFLTGLPATRTVNLDALEVDEGVALLAGIAGTTRVRADERSAHDLVLECAGLPLAIRILGARLAARPRWPIAAVVQRLRDGRDRFSELRTGDLAVESSFDLGYRQLDDRQARIFRWLSLTDAASISLPAAAALVQLPEKEVEDALEDLVDLNLIETTEPMRYRYHDLLRDYARHRAQVLDPPTLPARATGRLADFYLASARNAHRVVEKGSRQADDIESTVAAGVELTNAGDARGWLLDEHINIVAVVQQLAAEHTSDVDKIADLLLMLVRLGSYGIDRQHLEQTASAVAGFARQKANPRAEGRVRYLYGRLLTERHRFDAAATELDMSAALAATAGDDPTWERARARQGVVLMHYGRLDPAQDCFDDALDASQRLGDQQRSAITLGNLTRIAILRGNLGAALELAAQAVTTAAQTPDRMARMYATYMDAWAHLAADCTAEAVQLFGTALAHAGELGFLNWAGSFHVFLARAHLASGQRHAATEHAEQTIAIGRQLFDPYLECEGLIELGRARAEAGHTDPALASWREARALSAQFATCCVDRYETTLTELGV